MSATNWSIEVYPRGDTSPAATFTRGDIPADSPVKDFRLQTPLNDIGAGHLIVPLSCDQLGDLTEGSILILKSEGDPIAYALLGSADDVVLAEDPADQLVTVELFTLDDVLNDGIVIPPRGFGVRPRGEDRRWDWRNIHRDNSDATTPDSFGTVTTVNGSYAVTPYFGNSSYPDLTEVLTPAVGGPYGFGDDAPAGTMYGAEDAVQSAGAPDPGDPLPAGTYKFKGAADNWLETLAFDETELMGYVFGFVDGWETQPFDYSGGTPRIAAAWTNQPGTGRGPCTIGLELIKLDGGGGEGPGSQIMWYTTDAFKVWEFPGSPPGMNPGEIAAAWHDEVQAFDAMLDVDREFDGDDDSNAAAWEDTNSVSTKSRTKGQVFLEREMGANYCESRIRYDTGDGRFKWELFPLGGMGTTVARTIGVGDVEHMSIDRERLGATKIAYATPDLFLLAEVEPPAGFVVRMAGLDVQAVGSPEEGALLAGGELADFGNTRVKNAITDKDTDGRDYSVGDSISSLPVDRDLSLAGDRIESVTYSLNADGDIDVTPEFGDLIVPVVARSTLALSKLGGPSFGGRSRRAMRG